MEIFGAELFLSSNKKSHKRFCNGCIRRTLQVHPICGGVGFRERYLKLFWNPDAVEKLDLAGCGELVCKGAYVTQAPGTWAVGAPVLGFRLDFHSFKGIGLALFWLFLGNGAFILKGTRQHWGSMSFVSRCVLPSGYANFGVT